MNYDNDGKIRTRRSRAGSPLEVMVDGDPKTGYFSQGLKPFPVECFTVDLPAKAWSHSPFGHLLRSTARETAPLVRRLAEP